MVNMFAKFDEEAHNGLVFYRVHKVISINVNCNLGLWPLTFKIKRVHPLIIVNMSFDEKAHNGLVSIMFTRSKCDANTHARTHGPTEAFLYPIRNALRGDN